ncbi:uncharacterized protein LOC144479697 [Mustelus asterias]
MLNILKLINRLVFIYGRPASDGNSTVETICTFKRNAAQPVDEVLLYHEFRDNTQGIMTLGTYSLDTNKLYVNGYHESAALTTAETSTANTQTSVATLTSTTVPASTSTTAPIATVSSSKASTTEATTRATSIPSTSATTETYTAKTQPFTAIPTSTSAVASTRTTASTTTVISTETSTMEVTTTSTSNTSIAVEPTIVPVTDNPNQGTQPNKFNVTFTVLNLPFTPNLQNLNSRLYMTESRNIRDKLNNLYANSNVNATFSDCKSVSFRLP